MGGEEKGEGYSMRSEVVSGMIWVFFFSPLSSALAGHLDIGENTAIP